MQINFYQLQGNTQAAVDEALPALLMKAVAAGSVALVTKNAITAERLNERLWTFSPESFLPHQLFSEMEKLGAGVTLFSQEEWEEKGRSFSPTILVNMNGALSDYTPIQADKLLDIFTSDEKSTGAARTRWSAHGSHERAYFAQSEDGKWQKKA